MTPTPDELATKLGKAIEELEADAFCFPQYSVILDDEGPLYLAVGHGDEAVFKGETTLGVLRAAALALREQGERVKAALPDNCDGKEQYAFEAWAKSQGMNMSEHPLHYLFLDPKTDAARQGWSAAIRYCRARALQPEPDA